MSNIYIAGISMTVFGRHFERSLDDLAGEALDGALKDAGCSKEDIGTAFYAGITNGPLQGQFAIPGQVVLGKLGVDGIPIYNIDNGCAAGSSAFALAVQSLKAGVTDVALAIGAEKMNVEDKLSVLKLMEAGWDVSRADENYARLVKLGEGVVPPEGSESDKPFSRFMSIYAALCRNHMAKWGTTQRQIAAVSAKNHQHSVHNPWSQFRKSFTIDEVLGSPPISYPLTLPMCAPVTDGSAAAIICTEEGLKRIGADRSRCIKVAASVVRSASSRSIDQHELNLARLAANQAYEIAGQPFNLSSPKQLGEIFFDKLGMPVVKKTATGARSTDEEVLEKLAEDYPLPAKLLEHRGLVKLKGTYTDKLAQLALPRTGRVHTHYAQAVAVTGRLSSNDPNLQNIPIRTAEGRRVREAFVAPAGSVSAISSTRGCRNSLTRAMARPPPPSRGS